MDIFSSNQELMAMQAMQGYYENQGPATGTNALFNSVNRMGGLPGRAIEENAFKPNVMPLGGLGLERFGMFGQLASMGGSMALTPIMESQGILPMGNAGSYMQALIARDTMRQQKELATKVAPLNQQGMFNTFKGLAATMGVPFGEQQQQAARQLASGIAKNQQMLSMVAPGLLDTLAGPAGSSQALAAQMMHGNAYSVDPYSGQMGFSTEANAALVNNVYSDLYSKDNLVNMQGIKAGELGQFYNQMSGEGLLTPSGGLRQRTLKTLLQLKNEGTDLKALGQTAGIKNPESLTGDLSDLSNDTLSKLRTTDAIKDKLTKSDTDQVKQQLRSYTDSLGAIRELFGEHGDPNAPMPKLVQGIKAFSAGQMQRFDASQLNSVIRDVQSLSQLSGKSLDQMFKMQQEAVMMGNTMPGLQGHMANFAPTALNVGVTAGMAFNQTGAVTGFGALNREQVEQGTTRLFTRTLGSEMSNMMGALGRIDSAGGFTDTAAGNDLKAILEAAKTPGQTTYKSADGSTKKLPTRDTDLIRLISQGGAVGMNESTFRMFLGDKTSNLRELSKDANLQQAAMRMTPEEMKQVISRDVSSRLIADNSLAGLDSTTRSKASQALGQVSASTLLSLTPKQAGDDKQRNKIVANALTAEARKFNVDLTETEALNMAASVSGRAEGLAPKFGYENLTALSQVLSDPMTRARTSTQMQISAQAQLNQALSVFGPKGGTLERITTALMNQGRRGGSADISTMLGDILGSNADVTAEGLKGPMKSIGDRFKTIQDLIPKLEGASPEEASALYAELQDHLKKFTRETKQVRSKALNYGLVDQSQVFNAADIDKANQATKAIADTMQERVKLIENSETPITDQELKDIGNTQITPADIQALVDNDIQAQVKAVKAMSDDALKKEAGYKELSAAIDKQNPELDEKHRIATYRGQKLEEIKNTKNRNQAIKDKSTALSDAGISTGALLSQEDQKTVARSRRNLWSDEKDKEFRANIENQFFAIDSAFSEYEQDPNALVKGGDFAAQQFGKGKEAQQTLTSLAASYYNSDRGAMMAGNIALSPEVKDRLMADESFSGTFEERNAQLRERVKQQVTTISSTINDLKESTGSFKNIFKPTEETLALAKAQGIPEKDTKALQILMSAAKSNKTDFASLGITPEQLKTMASELTQGKTLGSALFKNPKFKGLLNTAHNFAGLSEITPEQEGKLDNLMEILTQDWTKESEALGLTNSEIQQYFQTSDDSLFAPITIPNNHKEISSAYNVYMESQAGVANAKTDKEKSDAAARVKLAKEALIGKLPEGVKKDTQNDESKLIKYAADLEPKQAALSRLKEAKDAFVAERGNISQFTLGGWVKLRNNTTAQTKAAREAAQDMDSSLNFMIKSMGITDEKEVEQAKEQLKTTSSADLRNKKLFSDTLKEVEKLNFAEEDAQLSPLAKLKKLSADPNELKKIKELNSNLHGSTIDSYIKNTSFTNLANMPETKQADFLQAAFKSVSSIDIKEERDKETKNTMTLSGEVTIKGDVVGTASFTDATGLLRV